MANYSFTLSNGATSVVVTEGSVDNRYTIPLLGQNTTNYGESVAQALMWSLENFAHTTAPGTGSIDRLIGQLWYNTTSNAMQVWNGGSWDEILTNTGGAASITGNLLPAVDSTYDIGSTSGPLRWRYGYFDNLSVSNGSSTGQVTADLLVTSSNATSPALKITGTTYTTTTFGDIYVDGTDLWFVNGGGTPVNLSATAGTIALDSLEDVSVAGPPAPTTGQMFWFNSTQWEKTNHDNPTPELKYSGITGKLSVKESTLSSAGLNIPPGDAPSTPFLQDGDVWTTSGGMYVRINGDTVGPLGAGGGGGAVDSFGPTNEPRTGTVVTQAGDYAEFYPQKGSTDTITGLWTYTARPAFNSGTSGVSAPFTVDSTYRVANLNAHYLDVSGTPTVGTAFTQAAATTSIAGQWTFPATTSGLRTDRIYGNTTAVSIYYGTSGTGAIITQDHTVLTDKLSAATVKGADGTQRDIGFATMIPYKRNLTYTFSKNNNQNMIYKDDTTAYTYFIPNDLTIPAGTIWGVANRGTSGAVSITCYNLTYLYWLTGSTTSTGNRSLAPGGVATIYKVSDDEFWIYGAGIS
jgi:hypothetical protein